MTVQLVSRDSGQPPKGLCWAESINKTASRGTKQGGSGGSFDREHGDSTNSNWHLVPLVWSQLKLTPRDRSLHGLFLPPLTPPPGQAPPSGPQKPRGQRITTASERVQAQLWSEGDTGLSLRPAAHELFSLPFTSNMRLRQPPPPGAAVRGWRIWECCLKHLV